MEHTGYKLFNGPFLIIWKGSEEEVEEDKDGETNMI
jgi:hypothetical protein